jgi:hypothetical protein
MKAYKQSLKSDQLLSSKKAFLNDFSSVNNPEGFYKEKEFTHDGGNEDIAMKSEKNSSDKYSKRRDNTGIKKESWKSGDSFPSTLRQDERMQISQSDVKDRVRDRKSDHTGIVRCHSCTHILFFYHEN